MDSLLEQVSEKLRTILREVDEIEACIANYRRDEIYLKVLEIKDNANDIKKIFNILKNS
jgi:DNA-binding protein H-NS